MTISLISTTLSTAFGGGSTTKNTASVPWLAGDLITVWGWTSDNANTLSAVTATGLTMTNRLTSNVASRVKMYLWTTIAGSGSSSVFASTASFDGGIAVKVYRGTGTLSLGTISSLGSGTTGGPNVSYTITTVGSLVDGGWGDWNAIAGARTYRTTNLGTATEDNYFTSGTFATVASWHNAATTASGAQTIGLTAPSATAWLCAGIEIIESGGGGGGSTVKQLAQLGVG